MSGCSVGALVGILLEGAHTVNYLDSGFHAGYTLATYPEAPKEKT